MAFIGINGPELGEGLRGLLLADDIQPGDSPSYATCKTIYSFHPIGEKLASVPIRLAQSKPRVIAIPGSPEERIRRQFLDQWLADDCDKHLFNLHRLKRIYGIASIALMPAKDEQAGEPIDFKTIWKDKIAFNVFDPLNTAGSLVGNLDPNDPQFLKTSGIAVNGRPYHRSRSFVALNEEPIYLEWTASAFGFVGRSVYQRTLYPLKSYVETMRTDALVARKAGVLVAAMKQAGSIVDAAMQKLFGRKREIVKDAETGNVIGISPEERIESLNLMNVNGAMKESRSNILDNIASGAGMPAILITSETFSSDFHEGTEDAKAVADYVKHEQDDMNPSYAWMDRIIQYRAWNPEFYATIQAEFPEQYGDVDYETAFYQWSNAFTATWPSLLTEPDSKLAEYDDVRLKAIIAAVEIALPAMDRQNRTIMIKWMADSFNSLTKLFDVPLDLDYETLAEYEPPSQQMDTLHEPHEPKPFAAQDSDVIGERVRAAFAGRRARKDETQQIAALAAAIAGAMHKNGGTLQ